MSLRVTEPLLRADRLTKTFGGGLPGAASTLALGDFSLSLGTGKPSVTAVVGESGSGKTTLARLLLGLATPTSGTVRYRGEDIAHLSSDARRAYRTDIQAIFQDPYGVFNPFYRVDHVLTTPVRKFKLASSRTEARALIEAALRTVGLRPEEILGRYPHQLSGGQRQRTMVARALLLKPKIIIADEPVSMVDASLRATILGSLRRLTDELGISILYITHDLATAWQVSDNIIVMYRAGAVEAGSAEIVVQKPMHPYTRLLVGSIPQVSLTRDWLAATPDPQRPDDRDAACRFTDRCPCAMAICRTEVPPLFRIGERHAAACHLHGQHPPLAATALNEVLA
jgi:oligopeptide/dipeptide ABC transporter ATP-binding protein